MNPSDKLSICLYSDPNFLAVNILENLLSRNCIVNIYSNDTDGWRVKTLHLPARNKFSILEPKESGGPRHYDYAIFCGGFINEKSAYPDYIKFSFLFNSKSTKTLVLFPFEIFEGSKLESLKVDGNTAVILVGDLLGPRMDLQSSLLAPRILTEVIAKRKITLGIGEIFYPVFISDAVRVVIKWLFSFGPYGKVTLLLGNPTSGDVFWQVNRQLVGELQLKYNSKISSRKIPEGVETETIKNNLNFSLTETYSWLSKNMPRLPDGPIGKGRKIDFKPRIKIETPKGTKAFLISLLIILAFPFLTLAASFLASLAAYKGLISANYNFTQSSLFLSQTFAVVSEKAGGLLGYVPGVGLVYNEVGFAAGFVNKADDIGIHAIPVIKDATQLFKNVLGSQVYNSSKLSRNLSNNIGILYNDTTSIKTFTQDASLKNVILAKKLLAKIDFGRFVNLISGCRVLADNLTSLLGQDQGKTYLVLFENNMELRPTGGFIGSFGLISFDGGRLTDLAVNDVYSADGQLNGHVEPPTPIKKYLNEANWWLRDSNWDPDFPTSAKRAEWFLDKEIGKKFDGVVSVDLFPIRELLRITGPIFLADYNMDITPDNLYEKTQNEVQNDFFPGTHKKASFITALSQTLLNEVSKLKANQMLGVLRSFYNGLNEKHVQVYLHDSISQQAFSSLNWDGGVILPGCGEGCYGDLAGIVEANVGVNKANYFVERSINMSVNVGNYEITRNLTLNLKNNANPVLGVSGKYTAYVRIFMPEDALVGSVKSLNGDIEDNLTPEITDVRGHKEVGVLVDVLGGSSKKVEFSWSSRFNTATPASSYGLYFRKQAGTDNDPISVIISGNGVLLKSDPRFALTREGDYVYNTTLAQDLYSLFSW
jgi:hypothetical protein